MNDTSQVVSADVQDQPLPDDAPKRAKVEVALQGQYGPQVDEMLAQLGAPQSNTLKVNQDKTFGLPDGTSSDGPLPFVIVDFIAENRWYPDAFNRNVNKPPGCAASGPKEDNLVPWDSSPDRQADACKTCEKNQWGSDPNGGAGKACSNHRLLALMDPLAEPDAPLIRLRTSPTAIRQFEAYMRQLLKVYNKMPFQVVTYIGFDPSSQYPSLRFGNPAPLENDEPLNIGGKQVDGRLLVATAASRRGEARELLMSEPDFTERVKQNPRQAPKAAQGSRRAAA